MYVSVFVFVKLSSELIVPLYNHLCNDIKGFAKHHLHVIKSTTHFQHNVHHPLNLNLKLDFNNFPALFCIVLPTWRHKEFTSNCKQAVTAHNLPRSNNWRITWLSVHLLFRNNYQDVAAAVGSELAAIRRPSSGPCDIGQWSVELGQQHSCPQFSQNRTPCCAQDAANVGLHVGYVIHNSYVWSQTFHLSLHTVELRKSWVHTVIVIRMSEKNA